MDSELIRRYVYAVTKRLPRKSREDVAKELNTLIADMLEERCGQVLPTEKDVRVVLTELGTPAELYDQYSGEGNPIPVCDGTDKLVTNVAAPILSEGDVLGCVLFAGTADKLTGGEVEYKLVQSIAGFLGRHMES